MDKAYRYRIYPNKSQKILLARTFGCVRFVYNHFLNKKQKLPHRIFVRQLLLFGFDMYPQYWVSSIGGTYHVLNARFYIGD